MKNYKNDIIFIAVLLILAGVSIPIMKNIYSSKSEYVKISYNDKEIRMSLNEDSSFTIEFGEKINIIEIKNKQVCIREASCPDKLCVKQGYISHNGESIICLPNEVIVTIEGTEKAGIDAIAE